MKALTLLTAALCLTTACTFSTVRPTLTGQRPSAPPRTLVIGTVQMPDPVWEPYGLHYTRGLAAGITRNGGFDLSEKGSAAKRMLIGMGAGQAKIRGEIELRDLSGATLAMFTSRESYLGGWGIGGIGFLDREDLTRRFAETVAHAVVKWARGEPIE